MKKQMKNAYKEEENRQNCIVGKQQAINNVGVFKYSVQIRFYVDPNRITSLFSSLLDCLDFVYPMLATNFISQAKVYLEV